ncbi:MAG: vitamin B12 dependent methionine synthase [Chloroflexi bacterium]|nr:vitamin B12 dependent methionine synthase [Chloroflexota bacterium]
MNPPSTLHIVDVPDFTFDLSALAQSLHIKAESGQMEELAELVSSASKLVRPRALHKLVFVDDRGDDYIILDTVRFTSRILRVNVKDTDRAFATLTTCGAELEQWADQLDDPLYRFWSETIRLQALGAASNALLQDIERWYQPGHMAAMNPGSLTDWPIYEQRPFFQLVGDAEDAIGVRLQPSLLMWPTKSVSSLMFPTSSNFVSCQLCPRQSCPNRRAPYEAGKMEQYLA